jgi:hypothetical protein
MEKNFKKQDAQQINLHECPPKARSHQKTDMTVWMYKEKPIFYFLLVSAGLIYAILRD